MDIRARALCPLFGSLPGGRVLERTSVDGTRYVKAMRRVHGRFGGESPRCQARTTAASIFMLRVEHLFISSGHNFFEHHGQPAGTNPMTAPEWIECVAGRGIRGDRFFDYKENYKGQITFFSMEVFESLRRELNLPEAQPQATRRNAFVRGGDLNALIGVEFELQSVRFAGVEESKPCHWMNLALCAGAEEWLKGRAGLRCRILTNGLLRRTT